MAAAGMPRTGTRSRRGRQSSGVESPASELLRPCRSRSSSVIARPRESDSSESMEPWLESKPSVGPSDEGRSDGDRSPNEPPALCSGGR